LSSSRTKNLVEAGGGFVGRPAAQEPDPSASGGVGVGVALVRRSGRGPERVAPRRAGGKHQEWSHSAQ
jgi:hypothetical protein